MPIHCYKYSNEILDGLDRNKTKIIFFSYLLLESKFVAPQHPMTFNILLNYRIYPILKKTLQPWML
jgi:hypothetical protein